MNHKKIFAVVMVLFGLLMLSLGKKEIQDISSIKINPENEPLSISPHKLTEYIIEKNLSYTLVDIREDSKTAKLQVDGSFTLPFLSLAKKENYSTIEKNKHVFLIGTEILKMKRAAVFLASKGFETFIIAGGINAWKSDVLNPIAPNADGSDEEFSNYKYRIAISNFLQGKGFGSAPVVKRVRRTLKRVQSEDADGGC